MRMGVLVDCCTFLNEIDFLEARIKYLRDIVDIFVVVEGDHTFNGSPKPFHIQNNIERISKLIDPKQLIYVPLNLSVYNLNFTNLSTGAQWAVERQQRNALTLPLKSLPHDTIVLFGDLDEIPRKSCIAGGIERLKDERILAFEQDFHYFNFKQVNQNKWPGTQITTAGYLDAYTADYLRFCRYQHPRVINGGWHLSYWGSPHQISYKISNFSHQEVNIPEFNNVDNIKQSMNTNIDLFHRPEEIWLENSTIIDNELYELFNPLVYQG